MGPTRHGLLQPLIVAPLPPLHRRTSTSLHGCLPCLPRGVKARADGAGAGPYGGPLLTYLPSQSPWTAGLRCGATRERPPSVCPRRRWSYIRRRCSSYASKGPSGGDMVICAWQSSAPEGPSGGGGGGHEHHPPRGPAATMVARRVPLRTGGWSLSSVMSD